MALPATVCTFKAAICRSKSQHAHYKHNNSSRLYSYLPCTCKSFTVCSVVEVIVYLRVPPRQKTSHKKGQRTDGMYRRNNAIPSRAPRPSPPSVDITSNLTLHNKFWGGRRSLLYYHTDVQHKQTFTRAGPHVSSPTTHLDPQSITSVRADDVLPRLHQQLLIPST